MDRSLYFVAIAFFGMINGMFSPPLVRIPAYALTHYFLAEPLFGSQALIFLFHSLMVATGTIILGGIPAAIYEHAAGAKEDSTEVSLWIWLAATALLTLPAVGPFLRIGL
jgi:hypothetical protein